MIACVVIDSPNPASLETETNKDLANVYKRCIINKLSIKINNHLIIPPKQHIQSPHFTLPIILITYQYYHAIKQNIWVFL